VPGSGEKTATRRDHQKNNVRLGGSRLLSSDRTARSLKTPYRHNGQHHASLRECLSVGLSRAPPQADRTPNRTKNAVSAKKICGIDPLLQISHLATIARAEFPSIRYRVLR
jgi:hypothetical protein